MPKKKTAKKTKVAKKTKKVKKAVSFARTPVIAVMGHVDHGKTSILDAIRGTKVQAGEAGGITQNTRAHVIKDKNSNEFTFIDTPGHEAFSGMRSRGASVTDIVMLVVAADDGVKPQTIESIKFAKKAKVPIVIVINKMDLPGADAKKVRQELSQHKVLVEKFGGDVLAVEVSATKKTGLDELFETLALQVEMMEIKKTKVKDGIAQGVVLESNLDNNLGPVALVLLKAGEVRSNNYIASAKKVDKIRGVLDESQKKIEKADEGDPIWLIGLDEVLDTGENVIFFENGKQAKQLLKDREEKSEKQAKLEEDEAEKAEKEAKEGEKDEKDEEGEEEEDDDSQLLAMLLTQDQEEEDVKKLNVILRTDAKGTLEAITEKLEELSDEEVEVNILESSTGDITLKDVDLAKSARAIILGFQVGIPEKTEKAAKREKVLFRTYEIIYELFDEVEAAMDMLVEPVEEEVEISRAKVKQVFVLTNKKTVAGCEVIKGNVLKGYNVKVERGDEEIGKGKITSLKKAKEEVKEVKKGQECGILIEPQIDLEKGDEIVCYKIEKL